MVQGIKPNITIIDSMEWQLLILGVTLIIFLSVILYFTRYYHKKKYYVSQEYDAQTETTKSTITSGLLKPCEKKGYCLVDKETGIKNCPPNTNTLMYYDINTQVCAPKNACPTVLPYAVNGDGSVNKYSSCENSNVPCRCTDKITCSKYVTSKFAVVNGNIYSSYASQKNFLLEQVPYSSYNTYDNSIEIDSTSEFCKINSTYSNSLVGGCSFINQQNDFLMKCDKESLDSVSVSPYSLDPYFYNTSDTIRKQFCEVQPYIDSNWNNMTLCVNQNPCTFGNYTYNFDKYREIQINNVVDGITTTQDVFNNFVKGRELNSRNFCQSYASNLDTYLTDLQYYTLSCIKGIRCNTLPNITDEDKFFAGENNELDISAINASYNVKFIDNTLVTTIKTDNATTKANYNPFTNKIRSGDILYNTNGSNWYIIRVKPSDNTLIFYDDTNYNTNTVPNSTDDLIYYPQYALNGYNYNTITNVNNNKNYKIGNVKNSRVPNNPGNGYNPSHDILSNQTFYRAGLSKPRGYVYKEFERETAVISDITQVDNQTSFNVNNYSIKETNFNTEYYNDISLYSPVWNNQYARTECIRCTPLIVASINMAQINSQIVNGFIYDAVTIQFSGQDFGHYRKNFQQSDPEKIWCFESRANINKAVASTPNRIYLERPNTNIKKGDFILSSNSDFNYKIVPVGNISRSFIGQSFYIFMGNIYKDNQSPSNFTPYYDDSGSNFFGIGIDNNTYQDFVKDEFVVGYYNGSEFIIFHNIRLGNKGGFFFGNKFQAVNANNLDDIVDVTIVPSVQVESISNNYDVITTTGFKSIPPFSNSKIDETSELQFISLDRNLYLNNDMKDVNKMLSGDGGVIKIDEITDGRITSIDVVESGSNYANISPLVRLKSYEPYLN